MKHLGPSGGLAVGCGSVETHGWVTGSSFLFLTLFPLNLWLIPAVSVVFMLLFTTFLSEIYNLPVFQPSQTLSVHFGLRFCCEPCGRREGFLFSVQDGRTLHFSSPWTRTPSLQHRPSSQRVFKSPQGVRADVKLLPSKRLVILPTVRFASRLWHQEGKSFSLKPARLYSWFWLVKGFKWSNFSIFSWKKILQ